MHIIIIGNGISGVTSARWIRKLSDHKISIISAESKFFFSRTALMYIYMGHMRFEDTKPYEDWFWEKNQIDLIQDYVEKIDSENSSVILKQGGKISYDKLILATGSKSNKFAWPGQDLNAVSGLYHLQDLENMEKYSSGLKRAVIVGGGLIGIEMAEMFHSRHIDVTMLVREKSYWNNVLPKEESEMISLHIQEKAIDLRLGVNLEQILDDGNGTAKGVIVKETQEVIDCGYVGLTAGVSPNIDIVKGTEIECNRGVLVDRQLKTNVENIYAIGDCAEQREVLPGRRAVEAIWYTGRMMGESVAYTICGKTNHYDPGIWFNSAKFFEIEYQVYGNVQARPPQEHAAIFWQHKDKTKSIRIVYHTEDKTVLGFNLLGVRYRHEVCEKWLLEQTHIEEVLQNLSLANFDPEFYKEYEKEVLDIYNKQSGKNISLKKKRRLDSVLQFLSKK